MRCIDADALIERLEDDIKAIEDIEPVIAMGGIGALNTIKKAPTVGPERPKGEWVEYIDDMNGARYGRCTSCNKSTLNAVSYDLDGQRYIMDFCPKCGADMRGEKDV